jgi:hypothetical protein
MNNGAPMMNTNVKDNNSKESQLTAKTSLRTPSEIRLTIPTGNSPPTEAVKQCPKSCLKQKSNSVALPNQQQRKTESRASNQIFIPVDQVTDREKSMGYTRNKTRRLKTKQERVYMFLEHPSGWAGFAYHMSV